MRSWIKSTTSASVLLKFSTSLRFGTPVGHQGSGTRHLTRISLRRLLNSALLKGFGPATVTLLVLLSCLVQQIFISLRMGFAPCGSYIHFNQDGANCNGGKWIIRFSKVLSSRFWEDLLLALVGDQLDDADNICGAVLSVRFSEDIISVWNRNASDHQVRLLFTRSLASSLPSFVLY
ncbi:uncharacterized protein LOC103845869 isoform X3 [Brassica rapa]|uniref:uncharacterized protein LOC103845869 isoform X3 n=1 Tax=Brassica campestris TaxID=3711 RepID=UPI00142DB212|nr:uncharacterized protein LOC103845869 isoform X3 [Brassica rapa]